MAQDHSVFSNIQDNRTSSLAEQVADQINQVIIDQNINAGEKLPNEFELAARLNAFVGQGGIGVAECGFHALEQRPRAVQRKPGIVTGVECGGVGAEPFGLDARNSFPVGAEPDAVLRFHGTGDVVESDFERLHAVPREVGNRGVAVAEYTEAPASLTII